MQHAKTNFNTVKTAVLTKDDRHDTHDRWFLGLEGAGKVVVTNEPQSADWVMLVGDPGRKEIDFDPNVRRIQPRMRGTSNFNSNNVSRDSYPIPHGSTNFGGDPKRVRDILLALVKANVVEKDWSLVNTPEFHNQTVGQVVSSHPRSTYEEVASKSFGEAQFYHGTSALRWETIKVKGLRPGSPHGLPEDRYTDYIKGYSDKNVYLTTSIPEAEKYAVRSAQADGSTGVVLSVEVNDFTRFTLDEDNAGNVWVDNSDKIQLGPYNNLDDVQVFYNFKSLPFIERVFGKSEADRVRNHFLARMMTGLKGNKTIAYKGVIPPNKLKVVETFKAVKMKNNPSDDHASITQEKFDAGFDKAKKTVKFHTADLSPPLGVNGGPCRVVDRILHTVKNPRVREQMVDEVQDGHLENSEARKIYPFDHETGSVFKSFSITPHAQYRMDYRSITVKDIETALNSFAKRLQELKVSDPARYEAILNQEKIEWVDPRLRLQVVFGLGSGGDINIITTYWKNKQDPPPADCSSQRVANLYLKGTR